MDLEAAIKEAGCESIDDVKNVEVSNMGVYITFNNGRVVKAYPNEWEVE